MYPHNYRVLKDGDSVSIVGHGTSTQANNKSVKRQFEGRVISSDIKKLEIVEDKILLALFPIYLMAGIITVGGIIWIVAAHS